VCPRVCGACRRKVYGVYLRGMPGGPGAACVTCGHQQTDTGSAFPAQASPWLCSIALPLQPSFCVARVLCACTPLYTHLSVDRHSDVRAHTRTHKHALACTRTLERTCPWVGSQPSLGEPLCWICHKLCDPLSLKQRLDALENFRALKEGFGITRSAPKRHKSHWKWMELREQWGRAPRLTCLLGRMEC